MVLSTIELQKENEKNVDDYDDDEEKFYRVHGIKVNESNGNVSIETHTQK